MIRIFKNKGKQKIEIDTIRAGQVLGELAFLDGNPRSASGEALTDCVLVEVSGTIFSQTLSKMPDWLKIMLKTIVGRLRTASTRIRQLEQASTSFSYSGKDGGRTLQYTYLPPHDVLKLMTATLLAASRFGTEEEKGIRVKMSWITRLANQIMGIPAAKVQDFLDALFQVGLAQAGTEGSKEDFLLEDIDFLEELILFMNEENLKEPEKKIDISMKTFFIMSLAAKHLREYEKDPKTGFTKVNFGKIRSEESNVMGKDPFRPDDLQELIKLGWIGDPDFKSDEEIYVNLKADSFIKSYRLQRMIKAIEAVNEKKK